MRTIAKTLLALLAALAVACVDVEPAPTATPSIAPLTIAPPTAAARPATATLPPAARAPQPAATAETRESHAESPTAPAPAVAPPLRSVRLLPVFADRRIDEPTNLVQTANGRVLVSEQPGRILGFDGVENGPAWEFLDITERVNDRGSEEGLLGMALAPDGQPHLYVYYSAANPRRSVISRFTVAPDFSSADSDSELIILEVGQPYANHNGGQIAFGPDGYLYIGLGDGGRAGDPLGSGQDTSTLLGSILRIDVSNATPERPYTVPSDNPFVGGESRGEIWAYGLRNPWRFSFDRENGDLWAGDVGQNRWEEIDLIERGGNYGWNVLEGNHCFRPQRDCDRDGRIPPVWEYPLDGRPCSVIGGYVYRGPAIPWLRGAYVYGDFCTGAVFGLRYHGGEVTEHRQLADTGLRIMSFAEDDDGELYLLSQESGVYRLTE